MTHRHDEELDRHLDRLMETAYQALSGAESSLGSRAAALATDAEPPEHIGPYPISELLGRGGTSFVYKGRDPELGRDVAIKVIDPRLAPALAQRFLDEARICSRLSHPGIVPIYAIGQLGDGRPYFTMRLVEGETLAALLDARSDAGDRLQQFLGTFARIGETVAFAHARGIVHGDLKPANVMVGAYGQVQVMDWGFSRLVTSSVDGDAQAGAARAMGTPAFMAPEQAASQGSAVDARTDVFGLGAILCVILTGAPPFLGGSRSEIQVRAAQGCLGDAIARLRGCGADPELVQLAEHCLARSPEERPASADLVVARVSAWFASIKERAHRLELAAAQAQVKAAEQRRTRRRSMALALLAVAFAAVYAWMRFERQERDFETRTAVVQALERARNLRTGADIAGTERVRCLGEASLAAQHAKTFAWTLNDDSLRREAEALSLRLDADRDAAVRDETMVRWLEDFPSHLDLTRDELDLYLAEGFRGYGVDVEAVPSDDVVARLRAGSIAVWLARALDDWGFVRRVQPGVEPASWRRFHELALRVDEDLLRRDVRRALLAEDRDALRGLADSAEFRDAPTDTLDLLANGLAQAKDRQTAIRIWQQAHARHPDSVRVIHSLAVHHFGDAKCPPWDEIVRLLSAGVALRPTSAHLWTDLSHALLGQGDIARAGAALHRALEIAPSDERALGSLLDLRRSEGEAGEALAQCRAVVDRAPKHAGTWRVYGDALLVDGFVQQAADAYRTAIGLDGSAIHRERLGQCLLELGSFEAAVEYLRDALERDSTSASAHANLALALRLQGRFDDAIAALHRAQELGGASWSARCDALLKETGRAVACAQTLAALVGESPALPDDHVPAELALVAHLAGRSLLAAQWYRTAFAEDPASADGAFCAWNRDLAAQAAAQVGAGASRDAAALDVEARAVWRDQAVAWLRDGIDAVARAFDGGALPPARVRHRLAAWRHAPALADLLPDVEAALDHLESRLAAGEPEATVHSPFDATFAFRNLGSLPRVLKPYGGLMFERGDTDLLVVCGHAQRISASFDAVALTRDARGHVTGFHGSARRLAAAPFADGGIARGPKDVLFYTRYPRAEYGQIRAGSRAPDRVDALIGPSAGGLGFVPPGLPGAGRVKVLAWPGGEWFDGELAADADGFEFANQQRVATLEGGPDGFAYVVDEEPPFDRPTLLVAEWSRHAIVAYDVGEDGNPIATTRRLVVSGFRGPLGLAIDPVTGDVLVSTWRGDGTEQLGKLERLDR